MVDALVAVVVVSLMIATCLASLTISQKLTRAAHDQRQARLLLQTVMASVPDVAGNYAGKRGDMTYSAVVTENNAPGGTLCAVYVRVSKKQKSWTLDGTRWCQGQVA